MADDPDEPCLRPQGRFIVCFRSLPSQADFRSSAVAPRRRPACGTASGAATCGDPIIHNLLTDIPISLLAAACRTTQVAADGVEDRFISYRQLGWYRVFGHVSKKKWDDLQDPNSGSSPLKGYRPHFTHRSTRLEAKPLAALAPV